jgi:hypothetical protein
MSADRRGLGTPAAADDNSSGLFNTPPTRTAQDTTLRIWMARRAHWWRFIEGASLIEIGRRLGVGETTVAQLLEERRP